MRTVILLLGLLCGGPAAAACVPLDRIAAERSGEVVEMPDLLFLILLWVEPESDGSYGVVAFDPLPEGGIGGRDICGSVILVPFDGGTGTVSPGDPDGKGWARRATTQALLLDRDAPLGDRYTQAMIEAAGRDQLSLQPATQMHVHAFRPGAVPQPGSPELRALLEGAGACRQIAILTERAVLVPICPGASFGAMRTAPG